VGLGLALSAAVALGGWRTETRGAGTAERAALLRGVPAPQPQQEVVVYILESEARAESLVLDEYFLALDREAVGSIRPEPDRRYWIFHTREDKDEERLASFLADLPGFSDGVGRNDRTYEVIDLRGR